VSTARTRRRFLANFLSAISFCFFRTTQSNFLDAWERTKSFKELDEAEQQSAIPAVDPQPSFKPP
jgi:hypothetical protein